MSWFLDSNDTLLLSNRGVYGGRYYKADYIEFDEEYDEYVIKQDFTADIYLKLQYGNDVIYLGFTAE